MAKSGELRSYRDFRLVSLQFVTYRFVQVLPSEICCNFVGLRVSFIKQQSGW